MTTRWEYLRVEHIYSTNPGEAVWRQLNPPSPEMFEEYPDRTWRHSLHVWRPGEDSAEVRDLGGGPGELDASDVLPVLNELGADGWELVGEAIVDTALIGVHGWRASGSPVRMAYTLKRRV